MGKQGTIIGSNKRKAKLITYGVIIGAGFLCLAFFVHYWYYAKTTPRYTETDIVYEVIKQMGSNFFTPFVKVSPLIYLGIAGFCFCVILMAKANKKPKSEHLVDNGFMTDDQLLQFITNNTKPFGKPFFDPDHNHILTQNLALSIDNKATNINTNAFAVAGPGGGKTFQYITPNLLHLSTNAVVTDPSGELFYLHAKNLENKGYRVLVFDIREGGKSLKYNPFAYCKTEHDVIVMVDTYMANTTDPEKKGGEQFWDDCTKMLMYALCLYLWHNYPIQDQTFSNVLKLVKMLEINENDPSSESALDILFDDLEREAPNNTAVRFYKEFKSGAGNTLKGVIMSANARLSKLELPFLQDLTSEDQLDLDHFADQKTVLFICIPTGSSPFNFMVSMLYSQLFNRLYDYAEQTAQYGYIVSDGQSVFKTFQAKNWEESKKAKAMAEQYVRNIKEGTKIKKNSTLKRCNIYNAADELVGFRRNKKEAENYIKMLNKNITVERCDRVCPNHVQFFLDEFANIGQIPDFCTKLTTIRKYRISCTIIVQSIAQLKKLYKEDFETILSACDNKLLLGVKDKETAEYFSAYAGKKEIKTRNESYKGNESTGEGYNQQVVDLLPAHMILQMNKKDAIVMVGPNPIRIDKKYDTLSDPEFKKASASKGMFVFDKRYAACPVIIPLRETRSSGNKYLIEQIEEDEPDTRERQDDAILESSESVVDLGEMIDTLAFKRTE